MHCDLLFIFRHAPYGSSLAREGLEAALAAGAFDQDMAILFISEGVWQLTEGQQSELIYKKNHNKMTNALPMFGIDTLYTTQKYLDERRIRTESLPSHTKVISHDNQQQLIANAKHILSF